MAHDLSNPGADQSDDDGRTTTTVETVRPKQVISDDRLTDVRSYEDAFKAVESAGGAVDDWSDYGTGFDVLDNKERLIDVPFVVLEWRFNDGDNGTFVSAAIVTEDGQKLIINDGSTGIRDQLVKVTAKRAERGATPEQAQTGLRVSKGLRVSRYVAKVPNTKTGELEDRNAATFYLA